LTNEELVEQIQQGINQIDNMELLYQQNRGFIFNIANRYSHMCDVEDLMQEGYFGLYEAVQRYEITAGIQFMSYASFWIRQAITRYLENNGYTVRIPSYLYNKIMRYNQLISAYEMQLGRKPTDEETRWYLRVNEQALEDIKKAYHEFCRMGSLDEIIPGTDDDMQLSDVIADPNIDLENQVVDGIIEESKKTELWQIVKENVTPEQNEVITARYRKGMSLEATGQSIGKTREVARKLEAKALKKLRVAKITRLLQEKFEVNYARAYRGSLSDFRNRWSSIVEDIAIKNIEEQTGKNS